MSSIQGRPLGIRDETFDVSLPSVEDISREAKHEAVPTDFQDLCAAAPPYMLHRLKLDRTVSEIKLLFYHLPNRSSSISWPNNLELCQEKLRLDLENWHRDISTVTAQILVDPKKWRLKLEQIYHAGIVLLYQPSQVFRNPTENALTICFHAAIEQVRCYDALYEQDSLHPGWRTVQNILACCATIVYCFWTSKAVQDSATAEQMPDALRLCSTHLSIGSVWWPSLKRAKSNFERLVDLTARHYHYLRFEREPRQKRRVQNMRNSATDSIIYYNRSQQPFTSPAFPAQNTTFGSTHLRVGEGFQNMNALTNDRHSHGAAWLNQTFEDPASIPTVAHDGPAYDDPLQHPESYLEGAATNNVQTFVESADIPQLSMDDHVPGDIEFAEPEEIRDFLTEFFSNDYWNVSDVSAPWQISFSDS